MAMEMSLRNLLNLQQAHSACITILKLQQMIASLSFTSIENLNFVMYANKSFQIDKLALSLAEAWNRVT